MTSSDVHEVLLNAAMTSLTLKCSNGSISLVFFMHDTLDKLVTGFNCILQGEMWMSRKLTFTNTLASTEIGSARPALITLSSLNANNRSIKLLGDGASNTQIADTRSNNSKRKYR
ncbi:hypothetical protein OH492_21475 [Vibrio chagasii]|nr:hypothetical protein [Vibrio chagasii]